MEKNALSLPFHSSFTSLSLLFHFPFTTLSLPKRMYNIIIYAYLLGVAIYSRFNEKVKKMWRGERDAFNVLREKV